jgi:hypothetical protein
MAPHPARDDQSRKMRSMSRWLAMTPSKDDRMDFCTKSCQALAVLDELMEERRRQACRARCARFPG